MKNTFLILALLFGTSVAFAQTSGKAASTENIHLNKTAPVVAADGAPVKASCAKIEAGKDGKACCAKGETGKDGKACCAKGEATKASCKSVTGKACCAEAKDGKACAHHAGMEGKTCAHPGAKDGKACCAAHAEPKAGATPHSCSGHAHGEEMPKSK